MKLKSKVGTAIEWRKQSSSIIVLLLFSGISQLVAGVFVTSRLERRSLAVLIFT